jgi:hypothetical protein
VKVETKLSYFGNFAGEQHNEKMRIKIQTKQHNLNDYSQKEGNFGHGKYFQLKADFSIDAQFQSHSAASQQLNVYDISLVCPHCKVGFLNQFLRSIILRLNL